MQDQCSATRRWYRRLLFAALLTALASPGWAGLPLAGQHYPNGAEDFVIGALPPPGVYLKNYTALIQKERLKGILPGVPGDKKAPVDFKADVLVVVPRFIWVSPYTFLGANWAAHVFLPLYSANVEVKAIGLDDEDAGLGDIIFSPFLLGWHFGPNFHVVAGLDIFAPTGDYDSSNLATQVLSKNSWTFEPAVALTYLRNGFDASIKFMYDFNTKNDEYFNLVTRTEGELTAGQSFHFDYGLSYAKTEGLRYGVSGYYEWQTTNDRFDGTDFDGRLRIGAAGPTIKWWPGMGRLSLTLKHLWEFDAKNSPEGQNTWLNAVYVF